jgi:hypothetical protein
MRKSVSTTPTSIPGYKFEEKLDSYCKLLYPEKNIDINEDKILVEYQSITKEGALKESLLNRFKVLKKFIFVQLTHPIQVYKQTKSLSGSKILTELIIPAGSIVYFSGEKEKRRATKAHVIKNTIIGTNKEILISYSLFDKKFAYETGKDVNPSNFSHNYDDNAPGIHFFCNKKTAETYDNW